MAVQHQDTPRQGGADNRRWAAAYQQQWSAAQNNPAHLQPWRPFLVVVAASVLNLLDTSITNIAAPPIERDIGGGAALIQWLSSAYTLSLAAGLLVGGRLGDIVGRRWVFCAGIFGFTLASCICGLAGGPGLLITARVLQGLSASLMLPQGLGVIRSVFPPQQLGKAFGVYGPLMGLAALCGPVLAGVLVSADLFGLGWRTVFLINVPIGLVLLGAGWRLLPGRQGADTNRIDVRGAFLSTLAAVLFVLPLVQGRAGGGWPWWSWVSLAASCLLFIIFVRVELATAAAGRDALVAPALFRSRVFTGGLVLAGLVFSTLVGTGLVLAVFLQLGLGLSPVAAAVVILPQPIGNLVAFLASRTERFERMDRQALRLGVTAMALGAAVLLATVAFADLGQGNVWMLAPGLALYGVGMGLFLAKFFVTVLAQVEPGAYGSASGALNSVQQFAAAVGVAALGTVFFSSLDSSGGTVFADALSRVLVITVAALCVAFAAVNLIPEPNRTNHHRKETP